MRVLTVGDSVRALAVSAGGVLAVGTGGGRRVLFDWASGAPALDALDAPAEQFAFDPAGTWLAHVQPAAVYFDAVGAEHEGTEPPDLSGTFAGGIAISPDGKTFVAAHAGTARNARLSRWSVPGFRPESGFEFWSPFRRLAFSPNGQFLAGANEGEFELRFAVSGGLDYRASSRTVPLIRRGALQPPLPGTAFVSFTRDSSTCAFGWSGEIRVLDISTGTSREVKRLEVPFRAAGFSGSGHTFVTADWDGLVKVWDARDWAVRRTLDWRCGPLTALAFTPDGTAAAVGSDDGRVVLFDLDD
jgi:WD40 repeat protein